jgi:hypothetical protein
MALTSKGLIAAYRDRSDREIRDVSYVVERGGRWSEPRAVASDGWEIHGCPVNGPQLDAAGDRVALAWFTMAHDTPRVNVAFSQDGGDTFGPPIGVDDGSPVGRVDVALVSSGAALVTWIETKGSAAALRARLIQPSGDRSPAIVIADSSGARSSGVPRLARVGGGAVVVWTDPGDPPRVRVARLKPRDS